MENSERSFPPVFVALHVSREAVLVKAVVAMKEAGMEGYWICGYIKSARGILALFLSHCPFSVMTGQI